MHKSFKESLNKYKEELKSYLIWSKEKKLEYSKINNVSTKEVDPMGMFSGSDYARITSWNTSLDGMKKVLNISDKENRQITKSVKEEL